ncbi:hypothetical protein [Microvirga zambiensis]|uniref:hypothetical protein n=1 Tax=Microvirga zambiensis TaxID=1402137 RepID=UPI001FE271F4|nr:hypothetical protein [Microvirga zambiensis]
MISEKMGHRIERVAQAIYETAQTGCLWADEPTVRQERFREYARNAVNLLDDDIGVLLLALKEAAAEERIGGWTPPPNPLGSTYP